jgi:hypothetical protein
VGADEVALEVAELVRGDACAGEGAEAGVDAVVREAVLCGVFDDGAGGLHRGDGGGVERDGSVVASDGDELVRVEWVAVKDDRLDGRGHEGGLAWKAALEVGRGKIWV